MVLRDMKVFAGFAILNSTLLKKHHTLSTTLIK